MKIIGIFISILGILNTFIGTGLKNDSKSTDFSNSWKIPSLLERQQQYENGETVFTIGVIMIIAGILLFIAGYIIDYKKRQENNPINKTKCLNCGNIVPNTQRFCNKCGQDMTQQTSKST